MNTIFSDDLGFQGHETLLTEIMEYGHAPYFSFFSSFLLISSLLLLLVFFSTFIFPLHKVQLNDLGIQGRETPLHAELTMDTGHYF
jgi:hypothetical protein